MSPTPSTTKTWLAKFSATIAAAVLALGATTALADEATADDQGLTQGRAGLYIKGDTSGQAHEFAFTGLTMSFKRADGTRVPGKQDIALTTIGSEALGASAGYFDFVGQPADTVSVAYGGAGGWGTVDGEPMFFDVASGVTNQLYNPQGLKDAVGFYHTVAPYGFKFIPALGADKTITPQVHVTATPTSGAGAKEATYSVSPTQTDDQGFALQAPSGWGKVSNMFGFRFIQTDWQGKKTGDVNYTFVPQDIDGYRTKITQDNLVYPGMRVEYVKLHPVTFEKADAAEDFTVEADANTEVEHGSHVAKLPSTAYPEFTEIYWTIGDGTEEVDPLATPIEGPTVFKAHLRAVSHRVTFTSEGIEPPIDSSVMVPHRGSVTELPTFTVPEGKVVEWTMNNGNVAIDPTVISIIADTTFTAHLVDAPAPEPEPTTPAPEPTTPAPPAPTPGDPGVPPTQPAPAPAPKPALPVTGADSSLLALAGTLLCAGAAVSFARRRVYTH